MLPDILGPVGEETAINPRAGYWSGTHFDQLWNGNIMIGTIKCLAEISNYNPGYARWFFSMNEDVVQQFDEIV